MFSVQPEGDEYPANAAGSAEEFHNAHTEYVDEENVETIRWTVAGNGAAGRRPIAVSFRFAQYQSCVAE